MQCGAGAAGRRARRRAGRARAGGRDPTDAERSAVRSPSAAAGSAGSGTDRSATRCSRRGTSTPRGRSSRPGGPTVKNVSGFDLCRLLVGSRGTLGFLGEVILRTRPRGDVRAVVRRRADPFELFPRLYRPTSVLWDGTSVWVLLEGHRDDVVAQAAALDLTATPIRPTSCRPAVGGRCRPRDLRELRRQPAASSPRSASASCTTSRRHRARTSIRPIVELHRRIKHQFDPTGRLNPGVDVLEAG